MVSGMLKRLCIPFFLGEIKCYPHRVRETNIVILGPVGFTSQVEEVFIRIYGLKQEGR